MYVLNVNNSTTSSELSASASVLVPGQFDSPDGKAEEEGKVQSQCLPSVWRHVSTQFGAGQIWFHGKEVDYLKNPEHLLSKLYEISWLYVQIFTWNTLYFYETSERCLIDLQGQFMATAALSWWFGREHSLLCFSFMRPGGE